MIWYKRITKKNWNYIWTKYVCNDQKFVFNHFIYGWKCICNKLVGNLPTELHTNLFRM